MTASQDQIDNTTQMGANLVPGGATFRVWAPRAQQVYICYDGHWNQDNTNLLVKTPAGYWTGFIPSIMDGTQYKFFVVGPTDSGYKRDPYARELTLNPAFPQSNCIVRDPNSYPWHDQGFRPPEFSDLVIYQFHVGTFYIAPNQNEGSFLDVLTKLDYLVALGVNAIQPLPIDEFPTQFSMGYNGTDLFSPEMTYEVVDPTK